MSRLTLKILLFALICAVGIEVEAIDGCAGGTRPLKLTGPSGSIELLDYGSKMRCVWIIEVSQDKIIRVRFTVFDVQPSPNCKRDKVKLFDGSNLIARLCGTLVDVEGQIWESTGNEMTVFFKSNKRINAGGFVLSWEAVAVIDPPTTTSIDPPTTTSIGPPTTTTIEPPTTSTIEPPTTTTIEPPTTTTIEPPTTTPIDPPTTTTIEPPTPTPSDCGIPAITPIDSSAERRRQVQEKDVTRRFTPKIVGGIIARPHSWPWMAAITDDTDWQYCGGSLIDHQWILTAAHCMTGKTPGEVFVRLGDHSLRMAESPNYMVKIGVQKIISHPEYKPRTVVNDVALLKLTSPVTFTDQISPVCLPVSGEELDDGHYCETTGWGTFGGSEGSDVLRQVNVPYISTTTCKQHSEYKRKIKPSMVCAGYIQNGAKDTCQGDSGGPLVCKMETAGVVTWVQHGITSWGNGCAKVGFPGVYGKVSYLKSWIQSTMDNN